MKTQNSGARDTSLWGCPSLRGCSASRLPLQFSPSALRNYEINRENGTATDVPNRPFPTAGLEFCQDFFKNFDWEEDSGRGYPGKDSRGNKERYWFVVKHRQSGQRIEGFYQEPNYEKGFPDAKKEYWYRVCFTDTENPAIRAWMKEKDLNYLDRIQRTNPALYQQETTAHPGIHQKQLTRQCERGVVVGGEQKKQAVSLASKKQGKEKKEKRRKKEESSKKKSSRRHHPEAGAALPDVPRGKVKTIYAYQSPQGSGQLSFPAGSLLDLLSDEGKWLRCQNQAGDVGMVPSICVEKAKKSPKGGAVAELPPMLVVEGDFSSSPVNRLQATQKEGGPIKVPTILGREPVPLPKHPRKQAKQYVNVLYDYTPDDLATGLVCHEDERLTLLDDSDETWCWCQNERKQKGYVPSNYLEKVEVKNKRGALKADNGLQGKEVETAAGPLPQVPDVVPSLPQAPAVGSVRAVYGYQASQPDQLTFVFDERLEVLRDDGDWWQCRKQSGEVGLVPRNYVMKADEEVSLASEAVTPPLPTPPSPSPSPNPSLGIGSHSAEHLVDYADLRFGRLLGRGGFGEVYRGTSSVHGEVAIKKLLQHKLTATLEAEFRHEAAVMVKMRHPNVLTLYGVVLIPECCMVLEFMARGSLYDVLHSEEPLSWQMRYQVGLDAARGLLYLHGKHILHRDLKSLNVLLDERNKAKLADFGLSKIKVSSSQTHNAGIAGTTQWIAPELFRGERYTPACDVYSLAMVLWELLSRQIPYRNQVPGVIPEWIKSGGRETLPPDSPDSLQALVSDCWKPQPRERPKIREVVSKLQANPITDSTLIPSPHVQGARAADEDASVWSGEPLDTEPNERSGRPAPVSTGWFDSATPASTPSPSATPKTGQPKREQTHDSGWWMQSGTGSAEGQRRGANQRGRANQRGGMRGRGNIGGGSASPGPAGASPSLFQPVGQGRGPSLIPVMTPPPRLEGDGDVFEALAKGNCQARDARQLSFMKGDKLTVIEKQPSGWWMCELNGKRGLAAGSWLQLVEPEAPQQQGGSESSSSMSSGYV